MLIKTKRQLIKNLDKIEEYLSNNTDEVYDTMAEYIDRGRVFISYIVDGETHFAPSRFIGYQNNTLIKHRKNKKKDGKETTPEISRIIGSKNQFYKKTEDAYLAFCEDLGVEASKNKRTYWILEDDISDELTTPPLKEGARKIRTHLVRERNRKAVYEAKRLFKSAHNGKLFCEVCGFNFVDKYGKIGEGFIEAHHKIAFSKTDGVHEIKPKDFAMVCSNCHSMLHRGDISILKLKNKIKK